MKDKIAKKQKAAWEAKKEKLSERQRLLREWESDQRGRYERTVSYSRFVKPKTTLPALK